MSRDLDLSEFGIMSQFRNQSPLALWAAGTNWGCHIRGCQWGITVVSKQLNKCYLVSKQLKNRARQYGVTAEKTLTQNIRAL